MTSADSWTRTAVALAAMFAIGAALAAGIHLAGAMREKQCNRLANAEARIEAAQGLHEQAQREQQGRCDLHVDEPAARDGEGA